MARLFLLSFQVVYSLSDLSGVGYASGCSEGHPELSIHQKHCHWLTLQIFVDEHSLGVGRVTGTVPENKKISKPCSLFAHTVY
jgi:hypothetical protein